MPQQIRGGEFVHGDRFPQLGPSSLLEPFNASSTVLLSQALFFETQSHAIKHDYFMQHSSVDAHSSSIPVSWTQLSWEGLVGRNMHSTAIWGVHHQTQREGAAKLQ